MLGLVIFTFFQSHAQKNKVQFNLYKKEVALRGYDAVSYFNFDPVKGHSSINYNFQGVLYYFESVKNKETFIKSPNLFLPEYGGWCAYAMGESGEKVEVDPKTYKIIGSKLYLFYNKAFTNTLNYWNKNENELKDKADENWKRINM